MKAIGFDLDQTLYPKSQEIDEAIQEYIFVRIAEHRNCSKEEGKRLFQSEYPKVSGRQALVNLGVPGAADIIQEALERADIAKFLRPDPNVLSLLKEVRGKFAHTALITGSHESNAKRKLEKLGIPLDLFDCLIFADVSKREGGAFLKWMADARRKDSSLVPADFLYVGDRPVSDVDPVLKLGMNAVLVNMKKKDDSIPVPQLPTLLDLRSYLFK